MYVVYKMRVKDKLFEKNITKSKKVKDKRYKDKFNLSRLDISGLQYNIFRYFTGFDQFEFRN